MRGKPHGYKVSPLSRLSNKAKVAYQKIDRPKSETASEVSTEQKLRIRKLLQYQIFNTPGQSPGSSHSPACSRAGSDQAKELIGLTARKFALVGDVSQQTVGPLALKIICIENPARRWAGLYKLQGRWPGSTENSQLQKSATSKRAC